MAGRNRDRKKSKLSQSVLAAIAGRVSKMITLEDLVIEESLQVRAKLDQETIQEYAQQMVPPGSDLESGVDHEVLDIHGVPFDPITVVLTPDDELLLVDGWHRVAAARKKKIAKFQASVSSGTRQDALEACLIANARHGLRRTRADKRRAIKLALKDPEFVKRSDRWIAEMTGVTSPTVTRTRADLVEAGEIDFQKELLTKDGRSWTQTPPKEKEESPKTSNVKISNSSAKGSGQVADSSLPEGVKLRPGKSTLPGTPPSPTTQGASKGGTDIKVYSNPGLGGWRKASEAYGQGLVVITPLPNPVDLTRMLAPMVSASCIAREYVSTGDGNFIVWYARDSLSEQLPKITETLERLVTEIETLLEEVG